MKKILISTLTILLLFSHSSAESALLSGLTIADGRIGGTVTAQFISNDGQANLQEIIVDCEIPEDIHPNEALIVTSHLITEKDMLHALQSIGQCTSGSFRITPESSSFSGNWDAPASSEISKAEASEQAIRIGLAYFDALGVEVERIPCRVERPNDLDAYLDQTARMYSHVYSDPTLFLKRTQEQWEKTHRYETIQPFYTTVQFIVNANGMRLWPTPVYPDHDTKDVFIGYDASAYVTVSDSGVLVEARASGIPQINSRILLSNKPTSPYGLHGNAQFIVADCWQEALCFALAHGAASNLIGNTESYMIQDNNTDIPVIRSSSRGVITSIKPYLYPASKDVLVPVWYIECASEYADGFRIQM